jgi:esterase/lipase
MRLAYFTAMEMVVLSVLTTLEMKPYRATVKWLNQFTEYETMHRDLFNTVIIVGLVLGAVIAVVEFVKACFSKKD